MGLEKFIFRIINQGASANHLDYQNRRIIYSNIIYVSLPIVYVAFVLIDIRSFLIPVHEMAWDQFIFSFEIMVCLLGIYLNRIGLTVVGRLIFILTWPFLLHIIPIWYQHSPSDYYLAFPIGIIFHAVLIHLMFSIRYEPILFWVLTIANFALMLMAPEMLVKFADNTTLNLKEFVLDKFYSLDSILYWLLFGLVTFFLVRAIDNLFEQVRKDQLLIEEQKEELAAMNEELSQSNESLQGLNSKISTWNESLEETVAQRTREIETQNEKLKDYAFYNAHKLRAPFCRIKGLIMLKDIITDEAEKEQIEKLIDESVHELDQVIQEIQEIVKHTPGEDVE